MKLKSVVSKIKPSHWVIIFYILIIPIVNFNHKIYTQKEGVITWDIKSYYAYLPATFIYGDLSLGFMKTDMQKFGQWIWPFETPTGKKVIITSCGLSMLYTPFFLMAHAYAAISPKYLADGYSLPYHVALQFSVYVYLIIGLFVLRKILLRYFNEIVTTITLLSVVIGTNLFYYVTYNAPMSHGFNFFLIILFIYYLEDWTDKLTLKNTIVLGLISGLIALVRPTNIVILILIPFWKVGSIHEFNDKIQLFLKNWPKLMLMVLMFILVWTPQFIYWKYVSGHFFYFTYGEAGGRFFFNNPQIVNVLFSYKKGWYVYTPLMFFATIGLINLYLKKVKLAFPVFIYLIIIVYVLSSWWCWWFGGSFGQRSMIDFYGIMAIPLAAFIEWGLKKQWWLKISTMALMAFLLFFGVFNLIQFNNQALNYWWMSKEGYWENFMKLHPTCKYWNVTVQPDYEKAHQGIYVAIPTHNRGAEITDKALEEKIINKNRQNIELIDSVRQQFHLEDSSAEYVLNQYAKELISEKKAKNYFDELKIEYYKNQILNCKSWQQKIKSKAKKQNIDFNQMIELEAKRIYNEYGEKYDQ